MARYKQIDTSPRLLPVELGLDRSFTTNCFAGVMGEISGRCFQAQRCLVFYFQPDPHTKFEDLLELVCGVVPTVVVANGMSR